MTHAKNQADRFQGFADCKTIKKTIAYNDYSSEDEDSCVLFDDVKDFDPATTVIDNLSGKSIFSVPFLSKYELT